MAVDSKKKTAPPPLPAPTETDSNTATEHPNDFEPPFEQPVDAKSSYSLPDDGTPVTIKTRHKPNRSQTSLLIEYFEGPKGSSASGSGERKPSVRVRLTPSKNRKNDHIQITETKSGRKTSLTRTALASANQSAARGDGDAISLLEADDTYSMNSYISATEESNVSHQPIDIEIDRRRRRPASPLIPTDSKVSYQTGNMSDISAIPTDSFLDGTGPSKSPERKRDKSPSRTAPLLAAAAGGAAAAIAAEKIRARPDKERFVLPKTKDRDRSERKRKSHSRSSSVSERRDREDDKSTRRKSSRGHQESTVSAADSSVVSSTLSPSHRSHDQYSVRSGASKSSINNPKLLETVEDAIRRLILPELNALKREQSRRHTDRTRSLSASTSVTSLSREDQGSDRRKASGSRVREPRDREARNASPEPSVLSQDSYLETTQDANESYHDALKAAAAGAAAGGLAVAALNSSSPAHAREERKRRRAEAKNRAANNHIENQIEDYDDQSDLHQAAPMPLSSEINPSELTRASILSAESDRQSVGEVHTPVHEVNASRTMGNTPGNLASPTDAPATLPTLGTQHHNVSHGDLRALPRTGNNNAQEMESDQYGRDYRGGPQDDYNEYDDEDDYQYDGSPGYYYNQQDVPAPLKYEPYALERRGLSPIPSVSGYTEGGSEVQQNRDSRVTQRTSGSFSPTKSSYRDTRPASSASIPSNIMSRDFDQDDRSLQSQAFDYKNSTLTDSEVGQGSSDQPVRGIGSNPNYVHIPVGVESAVASLIDGSMLDGSVLTDSIRGNNQHIYDSMAPVKEEGSYGHDTPRRGSLDETLAKEGQASPDATNSDLSRDRSQPRSAFAGEYELDQHGRKVPASQTSEHYSPTASEAAITGPAIAMAMRNAAANAKSRGVQIEEIEEEDESGAGGIQRNKSFKERTMGGSRLANTPKHSVDRLDDYDQPQMGASAVPNADDPLPEAGFYDDQSNPSVIEGRLDGSRRSSQDWSGRSTPTQLRPPPVRTAASKDSGNGFATAAGVAAGVAVIGTAAALAASHNRQPSQSKSIQSSQAHSRQASQDWHRTSDDRKRDTLITNPFEGNSPQVNLPGLGNDMMALSAPVYQNPAFGGDFGVRSPNLHNKVDEGYISQGANRTPENVRNKGKGVEFPQANENLDDPFYTPKGMRHVGLSQGLDSPLYDPSTGAGIDRIESKDIVALMQHLMVRDAQRSARDTEILMTLVRSAAEMRESFEKIKHMIADSEDVIIREVEENTEKTVTRVIGGPRPYPGSGTRSPIPTAGGSLAGTDDLPTKKQNLFRRALKGLSAKGNNDLGRIEDMLMQLLTEVDTLKAQTAGAGVGGGAGVSARGVQSFDNLQPAVTYEHDHGYEPEGMAGTSTTNASQSHLSMSQSRGASTKMGYERNHRISTVPEANEDDSGHQTPDRRYQLHEQYVNPEMLNIQQDAQAKRGSSVPLSTPPQPVTVAQASVSNENTPTTEKVKKGWFPKISRWSNTTTSSMGKAFRSSRDSKKDADWGYDGDPNVDPYGDDKLPTGFSEEALAEPEDPKYKAHRDSLNLQHPRPRPQACKAAIETGAEDYGMPKSPHSADWADSATSLHRLQDQSTNMRPYRYSGLSATSQPEQQQQYWGTGAGAEASSSGPPRPPKEPMDGRMTPPKSGRVSTLQKSSPLPHHSVESGYGTATQASYNDSPRLENRNLSGALGSGAPARRPSGPRAMTPRSEEERRRKRDTFGSIASQESETF